MGGIGKIWRIGGFSGLGDDSTSAIYILDSQEHMHSLQGQFLFSKSIKDETIM
jgi:hypothetical protein